MESAISIRFAGPEDIPAIGFLAQQIWPDTYSGILSAEQLEYMMQLFYSPVSLMKQMHEEQHHFLIIESDEEPVGFASYSATEKSGIYKLHKIYVLPDQQGRGLGKLIIDFILDQIQPRGAASLQLNVNRFNKARIFYEKLGFRVLREEDIDIGNNYFMNDYVMEMSMP
jgi:diamine N-acetyltransferase